MSLAWLCLLPLVQPTVATTPADRLGEAWWKERHEQCVAKTKAGQVMLVFLGDSITQGWEGPGKATWDQLYGRRGAANFGFSGDRTEHVLWRLDHGEIIGLKPKLIVIMIGTNNIGHGSSNPTQTIEGTKAIVNRLRRDVPSAKILLLAIFPRGEMPNDPMRLQVAEASAGYRFLDDGANVFFLDIGRAFTYADGSLKTLLMPDRLHLTADGYAIWGKAIEPYVQRLLGEE